MSYVVTACDSANVQTDGTCAVPVVVALPEQVLPPLTLEQGTVVAFAIVGCWTVGLVARLYFKAAQQRF